MPTLKKLKEDRVSIASKLLKTDKEFSPISPEFIKDLRYKILLEKPELKLSISDYKLMCGNDKVLNMMSIALNKPKAKLKKFCKYLSVFEKNINLSPKSIAHKINGPITTLPKDARTAILDKFAEILPSKYVLLHWIDNNKLDWTFLSENPNATDLLEENYNKIDWEKLCLNPNAKYLLKKRIEYEKTLTNEQYNNLDNKIKWNHLSSNPNVIQLLKEQIKIEKEEYNNLDDQYKIDWDLLSENPNAIKLLEDNIDKINWDLLSKNPNAIKLLKKNPNKIDWDYLSGNSNAIKLLEDNANANKINWNWLSQNFNPNAIDLLKIDRNKINWRNLSINPNAIELLEDNTNKINWDVLSQNPNAIQLLKENYDKINWKYLCFNINAIDLIEERIKYEKSLTQIDYVALKYKINWQYLSKNPAIFRAV